MFNALNPNTRSEEEVFSDLAKLCSSPGYIHAVAFFCWRDNLVKFGGEQLEESDLEHQHSNERLLTIELATLIGLMAKETILLDIPEAKVMQNYIDESEKLLEELHEVLKSPWKDIFKNIESEPPSENAFSNAQVLREPIFYAGQSAYNFQYIDLANRKYAADSSWLKYNKGFSISDACLICESLGEIQSRKQIEHHQNLTKTHPDDWTMLPGFEFGIDEVSKETSLDTEIVEKFVDAFSFNLGRKNSSFSELSEFNETNAAPILKLDERYFLLQHYSLVEAIYESPFFWMNSDKSYSNTANKNRGDFCENFVAERLEKVFDEQYVYRNVDIYEGKKRIGEIDVLVLYGDRALLVQAKSKRLTIEARKGNDNQLKSDFKNAIQDAFDQAVVCAKSFSNTNVRYLLPSREELTIKCKPKRVYPLCVVSDHYPALATQVGQFLKRVDDNLIEHPFVTDVFTIDVVAEMLGTPLHFINYLSLKSRFDEKILVSHEMTTLAYHLKYNLWVEDQYTMMNLGDDFNVSLDIAMMARRAGVPGEKVPKGILTRFENLTVGKIFKEIEKIGEPQLIGLGLLLLQYSQDSIIFLNKHLDQMLRKAVHDGKGHDLSLAPQAGGAGLTVHINQISEQTARHKLLEHCKLRKYDTKADAWYGLLLNSNDGHVRGAAVIEEEWQSDPKMDDVMKKWPKKRPFLFEHASTKKRKIGRNDLCPCGSGMKYKKCCLKQ